MPMGTLDCVGMSNSAIVPSRVRRPSLFAFDSENQTASEMPAIPTGPLEGVGIGNSVTVPSAAILPILFALNSVNQTYGYPVVIPRGPLFGVGMSNSVISPVAGRMRPTLFLENSVNQNAPSGPLMISLEPAEAAGNGTSRKIPVAPFAQTENPINRTTDNFSVGLFVGLPSLPLANEPLLSEFKLIGLRRRVAQPL